MRSKTYVPQPAVCLPEEECYWCDTSERKKRGQDLKHLNTTSGKTNDEGEKKRESSSKWLFCLEKKVQGIVLLQQPALVTHKPKGKTTIDACLQVIMSVWHVCMYAWMVTYSSVPLCAFTVCRKHTCLR